MYHSDFDLFIWIRDFLASPHFSQATIRIYGTGLRVFRRWCTDSNITMPVEGDVAHFRSWLLENYRITTAQTYLAAVKTFFSWLYKRRLYADIASSVLGVKVNHTVDVRSPECLGSTCLA